MSDIDKAEETSSKNKNEILKSAKLFFEPSECYVPPLRAEHRGRKRSTSRSKVAKSKHAKKGTQRRAENVKKRSSSTCMRPGPVTTNAYLNFLRQFRKTYCCHCSAKEAIERGARVWKRMSPECRAKYVQAAKRKSRILCKKDEEQSQL